MIPMSPSCRVPYRLWILVTVAVIVAAGVAGCAGSKTYSVRGRVVFKGGQPVTGGGRIEFQSTSDSRLKATGWIDMKDGSFSLTTFKEGKQIEGAVGGSHHVVVELHNPVTVIDLPGVYTVEPRANDLTIEVPKPRR
jgi:hypothetical protein